MLVKSSHIRPAKGFFRSNRSRLLDYLKSRAGASNNSFVLLKGNVEQYIYDDDQTHPFSQDNTFWWATGVDQPDVYALINVGDGTTRAYIPVIEAFRKYWERIMELEEYGENFELDETHFLPELEKHISAANPDTIYVLDGVNIYSGNKALTAQFDWLKNFRVNTTALYPCVNEIKLKKSPEEIELLREAARIGSEAHVFVLQHAKPGINESHLQTLFRFYCGMHGPTVQQGYEEICAAGKNGAVLHYIRNNSHIEDGQTVLLDAGTKINGYNSDITVTFPINGKFTEKQRQIYEVVLKAHNAVRDFVKAGVHWQDVHITAEKVILEGLLALGLVKGGTVEELWAKRVCYYFFPHGVGHYLGTYVHDLIGDPLKEKERRDISQQNIRVYRKLEESMVLTNEPGVYFIPRLIEKAKQDATLSEFFDFEKIAAYADEIPGVRIEDMLVVHADHAEGLTKVPRTVEQIERCMAGQAWAN